MRRDQFEIGLEREYALYASTGGALAYLLAVDRLLAILHASIAGDAARRVRWHQLQADGWRLAPEYAHCLVEIASPPYPRDGWPTLLAGFADLEAWLAEAATQLGAQSRFDRVECTAAYSVRTDRFVTWHGAAVTTLAELLLVPTDDNWLCGSPDDLPVCLVGAAPELAYAGFVSTNATVHPPMPGPPDRDLSDLAAPLADYYWHVLDAARRIERASPQRHALLRDGRHPVPPDPDRTIRDALIRWGDPATAALLDAPTLDAPGQGLARFVALFGQPPSSAFAVPDFHAYSCRPRVVDNTMLFELRCFHAGVPLAALTPLLDAAATLQNAASSDTSPSTPT